MVQFLAIVLLLLFGMPFGNGAHMPSTKKKRGFQLTPARAFTAIKHRTQEWTLAKNIRSTVKPTPALTSFLGMPLEQFIDIMFDRADTDKSGSVSFTEAYIVILKVYIKINRKAPIPPPSREKVYQIFKAADLDRNDRLGREEFKRLFMLGIWRASTRFIAYKTITLFGAPLLAWEIVRRLSGEVWVADAIGKWIPEKYAYSEDFWRSVLTVFFVTTLGSTILSVVSHIYDRIAFDSDDCED